MYAWKKNHSIRYWGKKAKRLVIKLKLRGREVVEKDVHDKSKLTDFGEECSWQVRTYIDFGEVQWC